MRGSASITAAFGFCGLVIGTFTARRLDLSHRRGRCFGRIGPHKEHKQNDDNPYKYIEPHSLSNERQENHKSKDLPNAFDRFDNCKEIQDNIVPDPFTNKTDDNHRNQKGYNGRNDLHVGLAALRIRPGHIRERIHTGIGDSFKSGAHSINSC